MINRFLNRNMESQILHPIVGDGVVCPNPAERDQVQREPCRYKKVPLSLSKNAGLSSFGSKDRLGSERGQSDAVFAVYSLEGPVPIS